MILPYVMRFNKRLIKATVRDIENNITVYQKMESHTIDDVIETQIQINDEIKTIYSIENIDPQITVILPLNKINEALVLDDQLSRLFLFYPLIGTEKFGMNFIIHSSEFSPTEQRDGVYLKSKNEQVQQNEDDNRDIIQKASEMVFRFLAINARNILNPLCFAQISFNVSTDKPLLNEYFTTLKDNWIEQFKTFPLVETDGATQIEGDAGARNLTPENADF